MLKLDRAIKMRKAMFHNKGQYTTTGSHGRSSRWAHWIKKTCVTTMPISRCTLLTLYATKMEVNERTVNVDLCRSFRCPKLS